MTVIEEIFPNTVDFLGKTNEDLALHISQLWLDGRVSATPIGRDTVLAEGDLVLSGDTLWTPVDIYANPTPEYAWEERQGVYRPVEVWLQLVGEQETEYLHWILHVAGYQHVYRINIIEV